MREYALVLLVTAAVTYLLTPLVRRVAVVTKAMHAPRARDTHTRATPLLGGLAMYGGLVAGLLVATRLSYLQDPFSTTGSKAEAGLLLAGGLIVVMGFADDRWGLNAISKLAGQVAVGGIVVWSGQALPWLPMPGGGVFSLEPDLSVTLTILLVVVTINAINFIDGLDGLAAGIVAVAALSFLVYSYALNRTIGTTSQSLPAVASALLAGMCLGFLPHNFYPARIFMGDAGAMLLGLLLAYGPISSTGSLDSTLLVNYSQAHPLDRYPTFLPLLVPAAIFVIPYADLMFAVIRRTRAGKPLMSADRQHLHHRLLNIGHSYRQSVLIMYLWAALFSVTVVSLSIVRIPSVVFAVATLVAVLALLPATMPRLRPWRIHTRPAAPLPAATRAPAAPPSGGTPPSPPVPAAPLAAAPLATPGSAPRRRPAPASDGPRYSAAAPPAAPPPAVNGVTPNGRAQRPRYPRDTGTFRQTGPFPGDPYPAEQPLPADPLPRAGRLPGADPFASRRPFPAQDPFAGQPAAPSQDPFAGQPAAPSQDPFAGQPAIPSQDPFPSHPSFPGRDPFPPNGHISPDGPASPNGRSSFPRVPFPEVAARPEDEPPDDSGPFPPASRPDARPR